MIDSILKIKLNNKEKFLSSVIVHKDYIDKEKIINLYKEIGDQKAFDLCKKNKVESIAAESLKICLTDEKLPIHWLQCYQKVNSKIKSYMSELDKVASFLAQKNIKVVALKNSGIARSIYPYYGSCPMGDIDVLVCKSDFRVAHQILQKNGYKMKFRSNLEENNIESAEKSGGSEYQIILDNGEKLWFELQWRPIAGRWIRPDQEPNSEDLIARSIKVNNSEVLILAPEDNLLQVCLHTAKHSYVRAPGFRLHTDVDRIVRTLNIDWNMFINEVEKLNVRTAVFFSLALARELLDSPIPNQTLNKLKPNKFKIFLISKWLYRIGIFYPDEKKWNKLGYVFFVSLLYDNFQGLIKGIFPDSNWMRERYNVGHSILLPFYYLHRLINLLFRRTLNK